MSFNRRYMLDILEETVEIETVEIAQAAFPKGNVYIKMRDQPGLIYEIRRTPVLHLLMVRQSWSADHCGCCIEWVPKYEPKPKDRWPPFLTN